MRAEIVAVGTELLLGQIADTNARWMSEQLATSGVDVTNHQAVGDNLDRIVEALRLAASRADVVLVCGGLGPTEDDITRDAIAEFAGVPLVFHAELETMLREKFRRWSAIGADAGEQPPAGVRARGRPVDRAGSGHRARVWRSGSTARACTRCPACPTRCGR